MNRAFHTPPGTLQASILLRSTFLRAAASAQSGATIGSGNAGVSGEVKVSGAVTLNGPSTQLGNGSTVTAGSATLPIKLTRGGELALCATTTVHLSQQYNVADPNSPLMVALDRGAIEAHYKLAKNSDVVLTPDLRILLSGPGKADVRIRVNGQGDTCVSNRGENAPYLTVSEQMGTGVYRVQPGQRVMFEHGSVRDVVDKEEQPCGCPAAVVSVANAGIAASPAAAKPGQTVAAHPTGPSSTPADVAFPLAESEGLAAPPALPKTPAALPGETHAEITTTLSYVAPAQTVPVGTPTGMATPESAATVAAPEALASSGTTALASAAEIARCPVATQSAHRSSPSIFHKIGHFFTRIFH